MNTIKLPPRGQHPDGMWHVQDLDDLPPHTELIEGQIIVMAAQRHRHFNIIFALVSQLRQQLDTNTWLIDGEMAVVIDQHSAPEPDVVVAARQPDYGIDTTRYRAEDVALAVEVESPATWRDDRGRKRDLYAKAGIEYYLRISERDDDDRTLVLHYYRLDVGAYVEVGSWPTRMETVRPWPFTLDLSEV